MTGACRSRCRTTGPCRGSLSGSTSVRQTWSASPPRTSRIPGTSSPRRASSRSRTSSSIPASRAGRPRSHRPGSSPWPRTAPGSSTRPAAGPATPRSTNREAAPESSRSSCWSLSWSSRVSVSSSRPARRRSPGVDADSLAHSVESPRHYLQRAARRAAGTVRSKGTGRAPATWSTSAGTAAGTRPVRRGPVTRSEPRNDCRAASTSGITWRSRRRLRLGQFAGDHVTQHRGDLFGSAGGGPGGSIDFLEGVVEFGVVLGDHGLAESGSKAGIEGSVPLAVFVTETDDDDIGILNQGLGTDRVDPSPLVITPELRVLLTQGPGPRRIRSRWSVTGEAKTTGRPSQAAEPLTPLGVNLTSQINIPGPCP